MGAATARRRPLAAGRCAGRKAACLLPSANRLLQLVLHTTVRLMLQATGGCVRG